MFHRAGRALAMSFYAVRNGRNPGIYNDWDSCRLQVDKFPNARYKKFSTQQEAENFIKGIEPSFNKSSLNCHTKGKAVLSNLQQKRHFDTLSTGSNGSQSNDEPQQKLRKSTLDGNSGKYSGSKFDESDAVIVYTDGACINNGKEGATAGIGVFWGENHPDNVCERLSGRQTNNRAEILAAKQAIKQAKQKGVKNLVLKTDSGFCINGITSWIHGWKRNGWKLSSGEPVVNRAEFEELDSVLTGINVKWVHVRGHKGEPGNEAADSLANEGAKKPEPQTGSRSGLK